MDEETELARRQGRDMLLAKASNGAHNSASKARDERKTGASATKGSKRKKTVSNKKKSKNKAGNKGHDGGAKLGLDKLGESDEAGGAGKAAGGGDGGARRLAKELGVEWPGEKCRDGGGHYFVAAEPVIAGGKVFVCCRCKACKWLPLSLEGAMKFTMLINRYGVREAYETMLAQDARALIVINTNMLWQRGVFTV